MDQVVVLRDIHDTLVTDYDYKDTPPQYQSQPRNSWNHELKFKKDTKMSAWCS